MFRNAFTDEEGRDFPDGRFRAAIRHDYGGARAAAAESNLTEAPACPSRIEALLRPTGDVGKAIYPEGNDAEALRGALGEFTIGRTLLFSGKPG